MFEITMLGTSAAMPGIHRGLSAVAVRKDGEVFLLDCGEGTQRQMMLFGVSYMKVKAIFISHTHLDHWLGMLGLIETMNLNGRTEQLTVYAPRGLSDFAGKRAFVKFAELKEGVLADFGEFSISAFATKHSPGSFGFVFEEKERRRFYEEKAHAAGVKGQLFSKIMKDGELKIAGKKVLLKNITYLQPGKKIVYTSDTAPCAATVKAAKAADLLIHEATFTEEHAAEAKEANHSTAQQAAQTAKKAGCKKLLLTHISGRYRDTAPLLEEAKKVFAATQVAEDGMRLEA